MHTICSGTVSFGLVSIPVKLHCATRNMSPHFRKVHAKCGSPIEHIRHCPVCKIDVAAADVCSGQPVASGEHVALTRDQIATAYGNDPSGTIHVVEVVDPKEIDVSYFETSYWVSPAGPSSHGFSLFRDALNNCHRVAIAQVKLRTRPRLAMLRPRDNVLSLDVLRFADELVAYDGPAPVNENFSAHERQLACTLLGKLEAAFNPTKQPDQYKRRIDAAVEQKLGEAQRERETASQPVTMAQVVDLSELLARSVRALARAEHEGPKRSSHPRAKRPAA
jgi:DNA end-binding protein Ku